MPRQSQIRTRGKSSKFQRLSKSLDTTGSFQNFDDSRQSSDFSHTGCPAWIKPRISEANQTQAATSDKRDPVNLAGRRSALEYRRRRLLCYCRCICLRPHPSAPFQLRDPRFFCTTKGSDGNKAKDYFLRLELMERPPMLVSSHENKRRVRTYGSPVWRSRLSAIPDYHARIRSP